MLKFIVKPHKIILIIICAAVTLSCLFLEPVHAAQSTFDFSDISPYDNHNMLCDNNGNMYVVGTDGNKALAKQIKADGSCTSSAITLNSSPLCCAAAGGCVYFAAQHNEYNGNNQTVFVEVTKYNFDDDTISAYKINDVTLMNKNSFAVAANGKMYFISSGNSSAVYCFDRQGSLLATTKLTGLAIQVTASADKNTIYAFMSDRMYTSSSSTNGNFQLLDAHSLSLPVTIAENNMAIDYNGTVTNMQNGKAVLNTSISSYNMNCGFANNYFCRSANGTVFGYDTLTGKQCRLFQLSDSQDYMYSLNNKFYFYEAAGGTFTVLDKSDFHYPQATASSAALPDSSTADTPQSSAESGNSQNTSTLGGSDSTPNISVSSAKYIVDNSAMTISGISCGTTAAVFKKNMSCGSASPFFTSFSGSTFTSGNVGTGTTADFKYNSRTISSYTLVVTGDLTGEGNVNSRDTKALSGYLLGKTTLSQCFVQAADCNHDGTVNTTDLLKIAKNNI